MRASFILLYLATHFVWGYDFDPFKQNRANRAIKEASEYYAAKAYDKAIQRYQYLLDTLKIADDRIQLNLAHAYMRNADYANAQNAYTKSTQAKDPLIRSLAYQQLGILAAEKKEKETALTHFKNALRNNPHNKEALHNYELLIKSKEKEMPKPQDQQERQDQEKKNEEQKKQDQQKQEQQKKDQQDKSQDNKDQQDKNEPKDDQEQKQKGKEDEKGREGEKNSEEKKDEKGKPQDASPNEDSKGSKEQPNKQSNESPKEDGDKKGEAEKPSESGDQKKDTKQESVAVNKEQLQKMNMTEQQAKALLNAMKQQEVQYIQQLKKQPEKKHRGQSRKDW